MWPIRSRFAQTVPPHASGSPIVLVYLSADRSDRHSHRIPKNVRLTTVSGRVWRPAGRRAAGGTAGTARPRVPRHASNIYSTIYSTIFGISFLTIRPRDAATVPPRRCETRRFSQAGQPNPKPRASLAKSAAPGACHNLPLSQQGSAAEGAWAGQLGNWMHDWM